MVNDLIQSGIDGLAVSPSNAAAMASALDLRPRRPASRC